MFVLNKKLITTNMRPTPSKIEEMCSPSTYNLLVEKCNDLIHIYVQRNPMKKIHEIEVIDVLNDCKEKDCFDLEFAINALSKSFYRCQVIFKERLVVIHIQVLGLALTTGATSKFYLDETNLNFEVKGGRIGNRNAIEILLKQTNLQLISPNQIWKGIRSFCKKLVWENDSIPEVSGAKLNFQLTYHPNVDGPTSNDNQMVILESMYEKNTLKSYLYQSYAQMFNMIHHTENLFGQKLGETRSTALTQSDYILKNSCPSCNGLLCKGAEGFLGTAICPGVF